MGEFTLKLLLKQFEAKVSIIQGQHVGVVHVELNKVHLAYYNQIPGSIFWE